MRCRSLGLGEEGVECEELVFGGREELWQLRRRSGELGELGKGLLECAFGIRHGWVAAGDRLLRMSRGGMGLDKSRAEREACDEEVIFEGETSFCFSCVRWSIVSEGIQLVRIKFLG